MPSRFANYKLGRRPPKYAPAITFKSIWTGVVPGHPLAADHFEHVTDWGLYNNDRFGVCGPVSVANQCKLVTKYLAGKEWSPTQEDVFDLYRRSGNPNFDPATGEDDNGVIMQTMLEALLKGGIGGGKPLAFASVDVNDPEQLRAAIAIFGSLLYGMILDKAQQAQTDAGLWDYVSGSPTWGGHAILAGRYKDEPGDANDRDGVITWAEIVDMTQRFIAHQLAEAWLVIWEENLGTTQFQEGIDLAALAAAFRSLTNRVFPLPPDPPIDPPPGAGDGCPPVAQIRRWLGR